MQSFFSSWVESVEWSKRILGVATTLKLGMAPGMPEGEYALVLEVNPLAYGYGLPLFAALLLASSEAKRWRKLVPGALLQVPFQAWGICFDLLKQAAVTSGPAVTAQTGLMPWQVEGVALGYQFGALILPAMAPIGLWLAFNRGFIPMLMLEGGCCAGSREILSARLQGIEPRLSISARRGGFNRLGRMNSPLHNVVLGISGLMTNLG